MVYKMNKSKYRIWEKDGKFKLQKRFGRIFFKWVLLNYEGKWDNSLAYLNWYQKDFYCINDIFKFIKQDSTDWELITSENINYFIEEDK